LAKYTFKDVVETKADAGFSSDPVKAILIVQGEAITV
jgi:hypothetical protein